MQKTAPLILLTLLLAATVLPNIALANFEPADSDLPANPNTDPPQVILISPQNLQNYTEDTPIPYSLTIKIPLSWFNLQTGKTYNFIRGIGYYIAPNLTASIIAGQPLEPNSRGILNPIPVPEFSVYNTTINLNGTIDALPVGNHTIIVGVSWSSPYQSSTWISYPLSEVEYRSIAYSNTTHFIVTNQTNQSQNSSTNQEPTVNLSIVLVASAATIVVAVGLLLTLKKRKINTS